MQRYYPRSAYNPSDISISKPNSESKRNRPGSNQDLSDIWNFAILYLRDEEPSLQPDDSGISSPQVPIISENLTLSSPSDPKPNTENQSLSSNTLLNQPLNLVPTENVPREHIDETAQLSSSPQNDGIVTEPQLTITGPLIWRPVTSIQPEAPLTTMNTFGYQGSKPSVSCEYCGQICEASRGIIAHQRLKH